MEQIRRQITNHIVDPDIPHVDVGVSDDPGAGGAHHRYVIEFPPYKPENRTLIEFQNGPIAEVGQNGVTNEALLAIVIDRLECFQKGPFACQDNDCALHYAKWALGALKNRTCNRVERGVEGKSKA